MGRGAAGSEGKSATGMGPYRKVRANFRKASPGGPQHLDEPYGIPLMSSL